MLDLVTLLTLNTVFDADTTEDFDDDIELQLAEIDALIGLDKLKVAVPNRDGTKFKTMKFKTLHQKGL